MSDGRRIDARLASLLFASFTLLYLSTAIGILEAGDETAMLQVTRSIVERGAIDVPPGTPGSVPGRDARHYSKYGLGQSVLGIPFYWLGHRLGGLMGTTMMDGDRFLQATPLTYTMTTLAMLASAGSVALVYLTCRALGFRVAASMVAAYGLGMGTFAWFYARTFMSESASMFMFALAFYAHARHSVRHHPGWLILAGTALGCAVVLRVANVLLLPAFALWLAWNVWRTTDGVAAAVRRMTPWVVPVAAGLAGVAAYNVARFGRIAESGYGPAEASFTTPLWIGLSGFLLSPGRSLFVYAPILLAAVAGWFRLWRTSRTTALVIAGIVVPYIAFHSRLGFWHGGGCWAPRYVVPILPFLIVGLAAMIEDGMSRAGWITMTLLGIASVYVQLLGILVSCIPYASRMQATQAGFEQILWHPAYAPVLEHAKRLVEPHQPIYLASTYFQSPLLARAQWIEFLAAAVLMFICLRMTYRTTATTPWDNCPPATRSG